MWDLQQGKCIRTLTGHSRPVQKLHADGQRLFSIGGRSLRVWDLATYACRHVIHLPRDNGALSALAVSPEGVLYIAGQVRRCCNSLLPCFCSVSVHRLHCVPLMVHSVQADVSCSQG